MLRPDTRESERTIRNYRINTTPIAVASVASKPGIIILRSASEPMPSTMPPFTRVFYTAAKTIPRAAVCKSRSWVSRLSSASDSVIASISARPEATLDKYGYLNAGAHSSPVLRDARLNTCNPKTLYLFNLVRGEILEYAREIVEKKLRELKPAETGFTAELDAGYKKARRNFKGRGFCFRNITKRAVTVSNEKIESYDDSEAFMDATDLLMDAGEA